MSPFCWIHGGDQVLQAQLWDRDSVFRRLCAPRLALSEDTLFEKAESEPLRSLEVMGFAEVPPKLWSCAKDQYRDTVGEHRVVSAGLWDPS